MHGFTDAWMYRCMDAWMYGCMDAWMHGCMDAWIHRCMDAWTHGCTDEWMHQPPQRETCRVALQHGPRICKQARARRRRCRGAAAPAPRARPGPLAAGRRGAEEPVDAWMHGYVCMRGCMDIRLSSRLWSTRIREQRSSNLQCSSSEEINRIGATFPKLSGKVTGN